MRPKLKPLDQQVLVVTGAGGGVGLAIAEQAVKAGAAVVLVGRDETLVRRAAEAFTAEGGRAHAVVGDLGDEDGAGRIARAALARFGRIDTWINGLEDERSAAMGAREAAKHFLTQGGGALVNIVDGVTDAGRKLRRELAKGPIALTEIRAPKGKLDDVACGVVSRAAIRACSSPMKQMTVTDTGRRLSLATEAKKHPGLLIGAGVVALGVAAFLGRGQIASAARPLVGKAVRPLLITAARRRPLTAAKLVARHPRQALKLASALR